MSHHPQSRLTRALLPLLIVGGSILPIAAHAQPFDLDTPPDSPLWWPLSDQTSTEELRAAYRDKEANQKRYLEAAAAGLVPAPSEEALEALKFYLNSRLTPELETIWRPLTHLGFAFLHGGTDDATVRRSLAEHGVSTHGREQILAALHWLAEEEERLGAEIGPKTQELIRMHWEILDREGRTAAVQDRLNQATKHGDVSYFLERTARSREQIEELLREGTKVSSAIAGEATLRRLRQELSGEDWQGLRRYLSSVAVDHLGSFTDF